MTAEPQTLPRRALIFIFATILIDAIGVGIVFPLTPDLMTRVGIGDTGHGAIGGGVLMAAYAAMQFLFAPLVGGLSDARGRRPILLVAMAALAVDYAIMAMATSFGMLLAGRLLAGIAGATHITATAYIADILPAEKRAAWFGRIGATYGLGFLAGPALGGMLAGIDLSLPFWVAGGFAAANVVLGLVALPESLAPEKRRPFTRAGLNPFAQLAQVARLPGIGLPLFLLFAYEFANMVYPTLWAFWSKEAFGWSAAVIGASFSVYGIGITVMQGMGLPLLVRRFGEGRVLIIASTATAIAFFAFGFTSAGWLVFVLIPFSCFADMLPPVMTAVMSGRVDEDRQGLLQGVIAALGSIGAVIAPLVLTPLFRFATEPGGPIWWPGLPYVVMGVIFTALLPGFVRLGRSA